MKAESVSRLSKGKRPPDKLWDLSLFVKDRTPRSVTAFTNLKRICREDLRDKCHIKVIDIERRPYLAEKNQIIAIPTLVKTFPLPARRVVGDLSNKERVLAGLDLPR